MLENNSFQELTSFLHEEFGKIFETYGVRELPKKYLSALTGSILKRYSYINGLEFKKVKYNVKVEWAKFTMPHGFLWKMFHKKLWSKVKSGLEEENVKDDEVECEPAKETPDVLTPAMSYPSSLNNDINIHI